MKHFSNFTASLTILSFFLTCLPASASAQAEIRTTGRVIVKYAQPVLESKKDAFRQGIKGNLVSSLQDGKMEIWDISQNSRLTKKNLDQVARELKSYASSRPEILYMEPDYVFDTETFPNDPHFAKQWGMSNTGQTGGTSGADIQVLNQWNIPSGQDDNGDDMIAGIIDTGIDWGHEDLVDNIWQNEKEDFDRDGHTIEFINGKWVLDPGDLNGIDDDGNGYIDDLVGWDFVNNDNNPFDDNGHGTHVAGIVGAKGNNGKGIAGVSWSTQMMALKAFDSRGAGSVLSVVPALEYARKMGASLTNNSWGGPAYSQALYGEMDLANTAGMLSIAAAGNNGSNNSATPMYPGSFDLSNIICVAATNDEDSLAQFSNFSFHSVDVAAPGKDIYSTLPGNAYGYKSGTSMATPMVTGAICLIWAEDHHRSHLQIKSMLLSTVDMVPGLSEKCATGGRLNIFEAMVKVKVLCDNFSINADGRQVKEILIHGNIAWLGSDAGIYQTDIHTCSDTIWDINNVLPFNSIRCLATDTLDNLWVGTNEGLSKYDGTTWQTMDTLNSNIPANQVDQIYLDHEKVMWMTIHEHGVLQFDATNTSWIPHQTLFPGLPIIHCNGLTHDSTGVLWIIHNTGVIRVSDTDTTLFDENNSPLPNEKVLAVAVDSLNNMWFGTDGNGLFHYDGTNWTVYDKKSSTPIVNNQIKAITIDQNGFIWVGTVGGLNKFDGSTFILYDDADPIAGLPDKRIHSLYTDINNNIWVGTQTGAFIFGNNVIQASFIPDNSPCLDIPFTFQNSSIGGFSYEWLVDGSSVSTETHLNYTFPSEGKYTVTLIAHNLYDSDTLSQEISTLPIPVIDLGPDSSICAANMILNAKVDGLEYYWENVNGLLLSSRQSFKADSTGTYILKVTTGCGLQIKDTIDVTLAGDCVWPGDVNTDGMVNMLDFLSLGIPNGKNGPTRTGATSQWNSEVATDWTGSFDGNHSFGPSVNYKHADCDGDGTIDILTDGAVVMDNAGYAHESIEFPNSEGITLHVEPVLTTLVASDTFTIYYDVSLKSATGDSIEGVYGFAFNLDYNLPLSQAPVMELDPTLSSDVSGAIITYDENNAATGNLVHAFRKTMSFGAVSDIGKDKTISRDVARIGFIVVLEDVQDDNSVRDFTSLSVTPGNLVVIDSLGEVKPVNNNTSSATSTVLIYYPTPVFPIDWLAFDAKPIENHAELTWMTAQETGREKYTIQRSADGNMFENLAEVNSKNEGTGQMSYTFVDRTMAVPENYYRIKRIEEDGTMVYSEVIRVRVKLKPFDFTVFPNPSSGPANIQVNSATKGQATMRLVGIHGNTILDKQLTIQKGPQLIPLEVETLSNGIYYLELFNENYRQVVKFTYIP